MYKDLIDFLRNEDCFIEAEGKYSAIDKFIYNYNHDYMENLRIGDDGVILLQDEANKWGLELRLYVKSCPPANVRAFGFTHNDAYRNDFSYRLNDNNIINYLFTVGFRIGFNRV